MPRLRDKQPRRREDFAELTSEQRRLLLTGSCFFGDAFADADEVRLAWEMHGEELTAEHIEKHPGTRPFAWWFCEHQHERPIVTPNVFTPAAVQRMRADKFGFLHTAIWCCPGDFQEDETEYLQRLGLLEFGELEKFEALYERDE